MKITFLLFVIIASLVTLVPARDIPKDPSLEYEIIDPKSVSVPKPVPTSAPTPGKPPTGEIGKTFVYDPVTKQWTILKPDDLTDDRTLFWNQSNDKWLTQTFVP